MLTTPDVYVQHTNPMSARAELIGGPQDGRLILLDDDLDLQPKSLRLMGWNVCHQNDACETVYHKVGIRMEEDGTMTTLYAIKEML